MNKKEIQRLQETALSLIRTNKVDEAISIHESIIKNDPRNDISYHMLGFACSLKREYKKAASLIEKAISLYKWCAEYYNSLAGVYKELNRFEDAIQILEIALTVKPSAEIYNNLGMAYVSLRKFTKSFEFYEKAIQIDPNAAFIHFNYALSLLSNGNYEKGWEEYEWRHKLTSLVPPPYPQHSNIKGKRILLQQEQGFGDNIQFIRYAKLLKEIGAAEVNAIVSLPLEKLFKTCPWINKVNATTMMGDYLIPMMSLPLIFKTTVNSIPTPIPYFNIPESKKDGFNIGIVWSSKKNQPNNFVNQDGDRILPSLSELAYRSAQRRFLKPEWFQKISTLPVKLWCLQPNAEVVDFINYPEIKDFYDTAELISGMDLIISIDTATAHLAGAMGKPTYLVLPYDSEWRWLVNETENSIWYPSIKIFRQSVREDWNSVLDKLYSQVNSNLL